MGPEPGQGWCLRVQSGRPEGQWGEAENWQDKLFYGLAASTLDPLTQGSGISSPPLVTCPLF